MAEQTRVLLLRWSAGEEGALGALLERHLAAIREQVERRLGPWLRKRSPSEDLVQDVLVEFLRFGPRFHISDDEHFRRLLARVVENVLRGRHAWLTAQRRDAARDRSLPTDTVLELDPPRRRIETPSREAHREEEEAWVRFGLELLEPERRDLIVQRQWEGLSFAEIGARLGVTETAARLRYLRALDALAAVVGALRRGEIDAALSATAPEAESSDAP